MLFVIMSFVHLIFIILCFFGKMGNNINKIRKLLETEIGKKNPIILDLNNKT